MEMSLELSTRDTLPDALRALVEEYPREVWDDPSPFTDLIQFWMERHIMFRRLLTRLESDAQAALDGGDPNNYRRALARFGGMLVNELHAHHTIEDTQYFPVLEKADPVFAKGLQILNADHHALDGILESFTRDANAILQTPDDARFRDQVGIVVTLLQRCAPMLLRHFEDEEDLVVPTLLKHEPAALKY